MGSFDSFADSSFHIKTEGEKITLTFKEGIPVSGQGTVQWNVPESAHGCQSPKEGTYCGIVIVVNETPVGVTHIPEDGKVYVADPTADANLHTGDKIGSALVVGAIYEGEKKARGEPLTTELVISNLVPNKAYYVAAYASDCQFRYHSDGVRAYSNSYGNPDEPDLPASQTVMVGGSTGIIGTDGTGLIPGETYEFDILLDDTYPDRTNEVPYTITIQGTDVGTYDDLIFQLNKQLAILENPPQSPVPPNLDGYFWNVVSEELFQFDGSNHNKIDDVLVEPTDPAAPVSGDYWYNPVTKVLQRWDIPSVGVWNVVPIIEYHQDPTVLECDDYWYNGTDAYKWNGSTWCESILFDQLIDPAAVPVLDCGTFWYNETSMELFEWNVEQLTWNQKDAIYWDVAPNALAVNTYWFDLGSEDLFQWDGAVFNLLAVINQVEEPTSPAPNVYWFNPELEELKQWNDPLTVWEDRDVLVWDGDPTVVASCDLWWRSTDDVLFVWDSVDLEWDQVVSFTQSTIDPSLAAVLEVDTLWYNSVILQKWDGTQWLPVTFINFPTDPTQPVNGTAWYNPTTNVWNIWDTPLVGVWNVVDPVDSENDPFAIPTGIFWFDSTNNLLFVRNGIIWQSVMYSTIPFTPALNERWFDSTNCKLMEWNGTEWVEVVGLITAAIDPNGCVTFTTTQKGSNMCVMIDELSDSLFSAINGAVIKPPRYGFDGLSGTPSYDQLGVGDDGTPDERRELMESIRAQLGYPVIEVELTQYQMDTAIQGAIESLRKRSSIPYRRGFFFLDVQPGQQRYQLTNRSIGYHKIVNVTSMHRFTSAFLSSAHGAGVYGQIVLQHLYNMGTFDLTSFHLVAQYVEQLEHLFATRLTFTFDETSRNLDIYSSFARPERVMMDCAIERTEQDLLRDRFAKSWIERYALSECMLMLAQIRGKYSTLPGAGGGVSLNAQDLMSMANAYREELIAQIDDYVVNDPETYGMGTTFIIG